MMNISLGAAGSSDVSAALPLGVSAIAKMRAAPVRRAEAAPRPAPCTRPAAALTALRPLRRRAAGVVESDGRVWAAPFTRRALTRPPHRARSARLLAAAAARPAPPRLPPLA